MSEPSSDQKIELLVRSVLEAVDARLAEVRSDVQRMATDLGQRLQVLEQRVDVEIANCAGTSATAGGDANGTINARLDALSAALDQLRDGALTSVSLAAPPAAPMITSLDEMNAPLVVAPITGQQPVLLDEPEHFALPTPPLAPPVWAEAATPIVTEDVVIEVVADEAVADEVVTDDVETHDVVVEEVVTEDVVVEDISTEDFVPDEVVAEVTAADESVADTVAFDDSPAPIDLNQLADLLSERLSSISLPPR